jgi:anti-sigma factor ChrR (cupin superfamily)
MTEPLLDFQSRLLLAIHGIAEADLARPERDGAWSIANVIAHLGDVELLTAWRLRQMLTEDEPALVKLSQETWVARLHAGETLAAALERFWALRRQNVALIRSLSADDLGRRALHPRLGRVVTVAELIASVIEHQEKHLQQIERIKRTHGLVVSEASNLAGVTAGVADGEHRSPGPGVRVYELWSDGTRRALQVEFDPGARWPGLDYHVPGPEEVFVLAGDFDDGNARYPAGTFLHHPAGTSHSPTSERGCTLFVFYPEG